MYRHILSFLIVAVCGAYGQSVLNCVASANPPVVRAEGIAERTGDVVLSCSGGQPNATVSGNLVLFLSVNVTNKVAADGTSNVLLTVNGAPSNVPARITAVNAVTYNGLSFTLTSQGTAEIRIQNLRGNASQMPNQPERVITLYASFTGGSLLAITNNQFTVGVPVRGLLSNSSGRLICTQAGSPLPSNIAFSNLVSAGSVFTSTRVTEGFGSAFAPLSDWSNMTADSGVRIIQSYSGFPASARIFVPDFLAGSDADQPTAGGDLGVPASGGIYTPGKNELLLVRVNGADANGAGGTPAFAAPASGPAAFDSVSEVALTNGAGYVVYEVVDANPAVRESAQFPTFLGLPQGGATTTTNASVNFAPVSNITVAANAPIPRFISVAPESDCPALGDCNAAYFPRLAVNAAPLQFAVNAGSAPTQYIPINNSGSGVLQWNAVLTYTAGSNFLRLSPAQGVNNGTIRVDVVSGLQSGTYQASILIDAGPLAGSRTIPVTVVVAGSAPELQFPVIQAVTSAADGSQVALVPGSLATITGLKFNGHAVLVTFDGVPGTVLYSNDSQINVQVPAALSNKATAKLVVSADGNASAPANVSLAASAPAIFPGAVLNQDGSRNGQNAPAKAGSVIQIFATGLPAAGTITAKVHDRLIPTPYYAGPAPGLTGVQQVNVVIPVDLPTMQTYVYVCGNGICSPAEKLWITE
jgi:uncharacterized protein (TIGR03437 family)